MAFRMVVISDVVLADMGNMSRADAIAVGDGGQPLDVDTEQAGERRGLHLAQLREPLGHVRHRAVMLAELLAGGWTAAWTRRSRRRTSAPARACAGVVPGRGVGQPLAVALLALRRSASRRTASPHQGPPRSARKSSASIGQVVVRG